MPKPLALPATSPRIVVILLLGGLLAALPLGAQGRAAKREVKRQLQEAKETLARGDADSARQLYHGLSAKVAGSDEQRASVLYGLALSTILSASGREDLAAAGDALEESAGLPSAPHPAERAALELLLESQAALEAQRAENKRLSDAATDLEIQLSQHEAQSRRSAAESRQEAGERDELEDQLETATETIAKLTSELETTRADLASRERTLEELRKKLVGDG